MNHRFIVILCLAVCTGLQLFGNPQSSQSVYPVSEKSEITLLNGLWDFKYIKGAEVPASDNDFYKPGFDDGKTWGKIIVPSNWELQDKAEPKYGERLEQGIGLYRTFFTVPEKLRGKRAFLRFEGVLYAYEIYVNGEYAGKWESAFNSQQFEISSYLKAGKSNLLAVKVLTHTPQKTHLFDISDHWALSGIFRDVILFGLDNVHFKDIKVQSMVLPDNSAKILVNTLIGLFDKKGNGKYTLEATVTDPQQKQVYLFKQSVHFSKRNTDSTAIETTIPKPLLWTAETPFLYHLKLDLYSGKRLIQSVNQTIGIREVRIQNGVLMVNNSPVKLKGVNMHEINPDRGFALTDEDRKKDLELARKANINYVRTSHYPHHPRFFELCDSLGFYVICEVPFNYSPPKVTDNLNYLPHLLLRANATVSRYKNHPSIIAWSIGNENRYAEIYEKVAEFTEQLDSTRPRCFPQAPRVFAQDEKKTADVFSILAPHYLLPAQLDDLAKRSKRPIIMTEYGHSLGLSTEDLEENWEVVRQNANVAGASIWMWSDQGIKRKQTTKDFLADVNPQGVWVDSTTYYDGFGNSGTDGIVYSNRHPQSDFWLTRKVYSPVWVKNKQISIQSGEQNLQLELENRFDFISLQGFHYKWTLNHYRKIAAEGSGKLALAPKTSGSLLIPVVIPDLSPSEFILGLEFYDPNGKVIYETTVQLLRKEIDYANFARKASGSSFATVRTKGKDEQVINFGNFVFGINQEGIVCLASRDGKDTLLNDYPLLRIGRKPTITLAYQGEKAKNKFYWEPYLSTTPTLHSKRARTIAGGQKISATYRWMRQADREEYIEGTITFSLSDNGNVTCEYNLKPYNATGEFMEAGIGFLLPKDYADFRWLGQGPFVSVPGKRLYNERNIWALNKYDLNFNGNRTAVDLAAFYKNQNSGLGFIGNKSDFGVELVGDKIAFTNNALVAGFGNKVSFTKYPIAANKVESISGKFQLIPLGKDSIFFNTVFFPLDEIVAERPFLKSYGF